jgi:hypothetical protein
MSAFELPLPQLTSEQEEMIAANYLSKLAEQEPDRLPYEIFLPVAKLMVMHTVEVGFVKPSDEDEESALVLLTQRPATDKFWAKQWHIPGSVVRATDPVKHEHDYDAAFSRVLDEVGGDMQVVRKPIEFDTVRRKGQRGSEVTVRLLAEVEGEPAHGKFFDAAGILRRPPEEGLIDSHSAAIEKVAATYHSLRSPNA